MKPPTAEEIARAKAVLEREARWKEAKAAAAAELALAEMAADPPVVLAWDPATGEQGWWRGSEPIEAEPFSRAESRTPGSDAEQT